MSISCYFHIRHRNLFETPLQLNPHVPSQKVASLDRPCPFHRPATKYFLFPFPTFKLSTPSVNESRGWTREGLSFRESVGWETSPSTGCHDHVVYFWYQQPRPIRWLLLPLFSPSGATWETSHAPRMEIMLAWVRSFDQWLGIPPSSNFRNLVNNNGNALPSIFIFHLILLGLPQRGPTKPHIGMVAVTQRQALWVLCTEL